MTMASLAASMRGLFGCDTAPNPVGLSAVQLQSMALLPYPWPPSPKTVVSKLRGALGGKLVDN